MILSWFIALFYLGLRRSLSRSSSTKRGRTREAVINDPSLETEPIATVRVQPVEEQGLLSQFLIIIFGRISYLMS